MTPEQKAAMVNAQVACAQIEAASMVAENMRRQHRGEAMAYNEKDFMGLIDKYGLGWNTVHTILCTY